MNPRQIVKFAVNLVVGIGAYGITRQVIDNNTAEPDSRTEVVLHTAGSVAVAGLVSDAASDRTDKLVDDLFDIFTGDKSSTN